MRARNENLELDQFIRVVTLSYRTWRYFFMNEENVKVETTNTNSEGQESTTEVVKTYTQEEVDALLQREADRRVTAALKKQESKTREAEKLAKMNDEQKFQYELEQREKAIAEKERALALAENKNIASKILAEKGISLQLVDFVVADDAETMDANIKILDKAFKASVKAEVEKRLGSSAPKKNLPPDEAITRDTFRKMSLREQQQLANENPTLYHSLIGK